MEINYLNGDATYPVGEGNKIIVHICNNVGFWNKGFVLALSKRWKGPEERFRTEYKYFGKPCTGNVQLVEVEEDIFVINMIAQQGVTYQGRKDVPIRYDELEEALRTVARFPKQFDNASIHMPRIGCGLAGGTWDKIEPIINRTLIKKGIEVFVYDFE